MAEFEVKKESTTDWYWILQADNNKTIAKSSEGYKNRDDCLHSIKLVKDLAPSAPVSDKTTNPPTKVDKLP